MLYTIYKNNMIIILYYYFKRYVTLLTLPNRQAESAAAMLVLKLDVIQCIILLLDTTTMYTLVGISCDTQKGCYLCTYVMSCSSSVIYYIRRTSRIL